MYIPQHIITEYGRGHGHVTPLGGIFRISIMESVENHQVYMPHCVTIKSSNNLLAGTAIDCFGNARHVAQRPRLRIAKQTCFFHTHICHIYPHEAQK